MNAAVNEQHCGASTCFAPEDRSIGSAFENIESAADETGRPLGALLCREAAHLIDWALQAELKLLLTRHASITDVRGRPAYVRNGYQPAREVLTNLGPVRIRVPKVRSRVERPVVFRSALVRPYLRRTRAVMHKAASRFLRALGTGDLHAAIGTIMGPEAAALPAPVIRRLTELWEKEHKQWLTGPLHQLRRASLWLDLIEDGDDPFADSGSVMLAVAIDESARQQILAVVHEVDVCERSWMRLLRSLRSRGMPPPLSLHHSGKASKEITTAAAMIYPETVPDR